MQIVCTEAAGTKRAGPSLLRISFWLWAGAAALFVLSAYSTYKIRESQAEIYLLTRPMSGMQQERDAAEIELHEAKREATIVIEPLPCLSRLATSVNLAYLLS